MSSLSLLAGRPVTTNNFIQISHLLQQQYSYSKYLHNITFWHLDDTRECEIKFVSEHMLVHIGGPLSQTRDITPEVFFLNFVKSSSNILVVISYRLTK